MSHKAHAEPTSFRSSACASLVERLSLDPKVSLEEAEERAKELSETLSKSSRKQRALLKKVLGIHPRYMHEIYLARPLKKAPRGTGVYVQGMPSTRP